MNNCVKKGLKQRSIALFMSLLMVLSLLPVPTFQAKAATTEHDGCVTIEVKDKKGNAVDGATVSYTINWTEEIKDVSGNDEDVSGNDKDVSGNDKDVSGNDIEKNITSSGITDDKGVVEILASSDFVPNDMTISATISKEEYETDSTTISNIIITSGDQNIEVILIAIPDIENIEIATLNSRYSKGQSQALITKITGIQNDDVTYYSTDGIRWETEVPTQENAGEYPIYIKITRSGHKDYLSGMQLAKIEKLDINVTFTAYEGDYDVAEHEAAVISGLESGDIVTFTYNNNDSSFTYIDEESIVMPKFVNVGEYVVDLKVERDSNYNIFKEQFTTKINATDIDGISATLNTGLVYNGTEQQLVKEINGIVEGDKVYFSYDDGETWLERENEQGPQASEANSYNLRIKVARNNYNETEIELNPATVTIAKANQSIQFVRDDMEDTISLDADNSENNVYNYTANGGSLVAPTITYIIENASENDNTNIAEIASIVEGGADAGYLTVKKAGYNIKITATVAGDNNYNEASVSCYLTIKNIEKDLISFSQNTINYNLGTSKTISEQLATKSYIDDNGTITYSGTVLSSDKMLEEVGIKVGSSDGKVEVTDVSAISQAIAEGGLSMIITAVKTEGTKQKTWGNPKVVYDTCESSYIINFLTEEIAGVPYTMEDADGNVITTGNGSNDWYQSEVTILPAEGYSIARDSVISNYGNSVVFGETKDGIAQDQGETNRVIYLKNNDTGGITAPIIAVEKLDSMKPYNQSIDFPETEEKDNIKYYNDKITITFTAYDNTSGVDIFAWSYTRSEDASISNLAAVSGTLKAVQDANDATKYTATLLLPKEEAEQLRGYLMVSATDYAGNVSDSLTDQGVFVIDTKSPTRAVNYQLVDNQEVHQTVDIKHYFSGDVEFTFNVIEANFYPSDVHITILKDGGTAIEQIVSWNATEQLDEYEAKLILSNEGHYIIGMTYIDRSSKEMESYVSETIVIDKTAPVIAFSYADYSAAINPQTATITITEHNFRQGDIVVNTELKTITDSSVNINDFQDYLRNCQWKSEGDVHTATISDQFADAIYVLTLNYNDLALNSATEVVTDKFIVDHIAPSTATMSVSYSQSLKDTVLSAITFGYYNPSVTVTFTAYDVTSGVDYFTWSYIRQSGVSASNIEKYADTRLTAVQNATDKTKFTASVTLPKEKADQLRGNIAFTTTDKFGNTSEKLTDYNYVIVVDTISPTMTAEYTIPENTFKDKEYYSKSVSAKFTVTEANFNSEDVIVKLTKDDGTATVVTPTWMEISPEVHVGTYTIEALNSHANDGDYTFAVSYTDRSNNTMNNYTSSVLVVDTTIPVIRVEYSNQNPINTLTDSEGNSRKYFAGTQTATVTIIEHNFNADQVEYAITAKDVAGNAMDANSLYSKSSWTTNGDSNVITIHYPGDANYAFNITYTDLAKLKAADYGTEYFTVDKTKPTDLKVSYSTSILDTILSNITFGFYNAKMNVTITATDNISGVNSFKYNYINALGVSNVNAQLTDEVMDASRITYSEGGAIGTTNFEISKSDLGSNSQFNGTINFDATDRAGNESDYLNDTKRIVVDNIAPTANVQYNAPVQNVNNISYYDGDINATVTMDEANFYSEDVVISVTKDGSPYTVNPSWSDNSTDVHTGTFTLTGDGDYFVNITYIDKSSNAMQQYTSEQMTIDTDIVEATITVNGNEADGKAFKEEVIPAVSFEDTNFERYEIKLTRTSYANMDIDVTEQFVSGRIATNALGGSGEFDTFDKLAENDGIYTMTVLLADKAGHTIEKSVTFTVNRFGSVYEYSDYFVSLIEDGGAYVKEVERDLVITEYNADRLLNKSLIIEISRDGKPIDSSKYDVIPEINDTVAIGDSGWYQYQYTINKENFMSDGVYKISVSSKDATGNTPENTNYRDKAILFRVDSTPPEINSITGLETSIINATNAEVKYTVFDTIGLDSVAVYVDGKETEHITDFSVDSNNYSGGIVLSESSSAQTVRLVVKDLVGNITDTDSDDFTSAYTFSGTVTVSTNTLVRFMANKQLFWGSVAGGGAFIGSVSGVVVFTRRKKMLSGI